MTSETKDTSVTSFNEIANMFTSTFSEVDLALFTASEHEAIGMEHFLIEPKCNRNLVGVFDFESFHSQKFCDVEDFSGAIEYDEIKQYDWDAVHSNIAQEIQKEKLEFVGERQVAHDEVLNGESMRPTTGEEFILDAKPVDKVGNLDHGPCKESYLGNQGLESLPPDLNERDCTAAIPDMSSGSVSAVHFTRNQNSPVLDQMTFQELLEAFRSMFGRETSVTDEHWLKHHVLLGLRNQVGSDNGLNLIKCDTTSYKTEEKTVCSCSSDSSVGAVDSINCILGDENMLVGWHAERKGLDALKTSSSEFSEVELCSLDEGDKAVVAKKRLRKPPKRFIEESLETKSRYFKGKSGALRSRKCPKGFGASQLICPEKSFKGSCIQVPFGLPVEEGHTKTTASYWESEDCRGDRLPSPKEELDTEPCSAPSPNRISEYEFVTRSNPRKGSSHRKHHISWSPSEVMKLIEGVTKCGVGRWAEIKRLLFPSSSRRTSVDLKDKWRNLLRASCAQLQSKRKLKQGKKQAVHRVPDSVLWRVRELAASTYPYGRGSNSEASFTTPVAVSFRAASNTMSVALSTTVSG